MFSNDKRLDAVAVRVLAKITTQKTRQEKVNYVKGLLFTVPIYQSLSFPPVLTEREAECLYHAALGATSHETAQKMSVKTSTIIAHRKEALRKLHCRNMPQAIFKGVCTGLLPFKKS